MDVELVQVGDIVNEVSKIDQSTKRIKITNVADEDGTKIIQSVVLP
jgi:hypothetical protein